MLSVLRYGRQSSIRLELAEGQLVAEWGRPSDEPLADAGRAVRDALADPLDYPALERATTPADRVVVAIGEGVPRSGELAAAVVESLAAAGVTAEGITVLQTAADAAAGVGDPRQWLSEPLAKEITLAAHDPSDRRSLAFLASVESGERIVLNRAIVDADVVVPIGAVRNPTAIGYHGMHGAIYPTFADERTVERFRSASAVNVRGRTKRQVVEAVAQVGWLLGVTLAVQVVPGAGDAILHIVAGEAGAVERRSLALYEAAWRVPASARADLVVAAIEGGPAEQTWENLGRALAAADRLVEDEGAIAICCELAGEPGPAYKRLAESRSRPAALEAIRRERSRDAQSARQLAQTQERAQVYLLSGLDAALVEDLEIAAITEPSDLTRLASRHRLCIVLGNAPRAIVGGAEDER